MATSSNLRTSTDGPIARITITRPAKLNALDLATLEELAEAARSLDNMDAVKVVVVTGEGSSFSAGFDLGAQGPRGSDPAERNARLGRAMAEAIAGMRAITIAAVRGHCIGGGVVLAAACDLRIASSTASFRIPEVDLGIPLYWTGVPLLVRELGPALTKELVLTGRAFDADEARQIRFVNRVVPDDELEDETEDLATTLAAKAGLVLRTTKLQVADALASSSDGDGGVEADIDGFAAAFRDPEARALAADYVARRRAGSERSLSESDE